MPEKDGDEGKSTKSVVNKKQKQMMGEEGYDIARDMGRVRPSKDKKDATTMPPSKEMKKTQKVNKGPSAFERVKARYGKSVMKVEELDLTQVAEAFGGDIVEVTRITGDNYKKFIKNIKKGEPPIGDIRNPDSAYDYNQLTGKEKEEYMKIKKEFEGSRRQKPPITGDSGQRDRPRVTFGQGQEPKKRAPRKGVDYFFDPKKAKAEREKLVSKRKQYEIDDKGNITDRGVEKYARQMYRTNEPLTKDQLSKAKEFAVGGKEVKDSKGKVIGTTTGKYGGKLSPQASEKEMKQTQAYLKKRGLTKAFTGDKPPTKDDVKPKPDRVTTGDDRKTDTRSSVDIPSPKGSLLSRIRKSGMGVVKNVAKSPVAPLIGYDLGKGIVSKIDQVMFPPVRGGRAGTRTAGSFTAS